MGRRSCINQTARNQSIGREHLRVTLINLSIIRIRTRKASNLCSVREKFVIQAEKCCYLVEVVELYCAKKVSCF